MTTKITFDLTRDIGQQKKFWRSTGFTPAELLLLPEMQQTLDYLSALPNKGVEYQRIHYLLNLVRCQKTAAGWRYDWDVLDQALDVLVSKRFKPFFEIMGNPSDAFDNFDDMDQIRRWRDFTSEMAARYQVRFGVDETRSWYFESWNEPDLSWWAWGERGYLNYYDACVEGLKAVDPLLRIGGPGTARPLSAMFKAFVAHCDSGVNCLTGETGVRLDFVSVHEKGAKKHAEDLQPHSLGIIEREMDAVRWLRAHHPRLANLPFINNECDPQVGWIIPHTWHALPYFAGLIVKIIDQHQRLMADAEGVDYDILSNDNGFIGRWGHRTHLAYFGGREIKAAQAEHRYNPEAFAKIRTADQPFDLVKKPGLTVMEFLSILGKERAAVTASPPLDPDKAGLGLMATKDGDTRAVALLYNSVDRIWCSGESRVELVFEGLADGAYHVGVFRLDDDHGTAFWEWEKHDAPDSPNAAELAAMRRVEDVRLDGAVAVTKSTGGRLTLDAMTVPLPAVAMVVVEKVDTTVPPTVVGLKASKHVGINHTDDVLLTWDHPESSRLLRYDVLHAATPEGPFVKLNKEPLLSAIHLHAARPGKGQYRIRTLTLGGATAQSTVITA
ncbi:MAG: GH39 family glycosyl hydrolase [Beijerinckiaceae bacterium]